MKTFKDLKFKPHTIAKFAYPNAKQARETFENGYGVSVIFGNCFCSNGIDTYELAVLYNGSITYNTCITNDVLGYISKEKVTEVMIQVASLKP